MGGGGGREWGKGGKRGPESGYLIDEKVLKTFAEGRGGCRGRNVAGVYEGGQGAEEDLGFVTARGDQGGNIV